MAFQEDSIYWVEVEKIVPNPFQPRREFDEERLKELSESIRMYGVLQPLTVTRNEVQREDGTFFTEYELIAGERRLRASKLAGLSQVPVIIREGRENEQEKLELAIIENLQREDLNSVDRALAFQQLAEVFNLKHAQVAKKVGRSREYVSNTIRLLNLPPHMLDHLRKRKMTEGHARTLLMLSDRPEEQEVLFREMLLKRLSVREVEKIARRIAADKVRRKEDNDFDDEILAIEKQFTESLGTRVQIQKTNFGGKLTIDYFDLGDLEQLLGKIRDERLELGPSIYHKKTSAINDSTALEIEVEGEDDEGEGEKKTEVGFSNNNNLKNDDEISEEEIEFKFKNEIPQIRPDTFPQVFEKKEMIEYQQHSSEKTFSNSFEKEQKEREWSGSENRVTPITEFKSRAEIEAERLEKEQAEMRRLEAEAEKKREIERKEREEREQERLRLEKEQKEREEAEERRLEAEIKAEEERKKKEEMRRLEEIARFVAPKFESEPEFSPIKIDENLSPEERRKRAEEAWLKEYGFSQEGNKQISKENKEVENNLSQVSLKEVKDTEEKKTEKIEEIDLGSKFDKPKIVAVSQNKSIYNPQTRVDNYSDGYSSFRSYANKHPQTDIQKNNGQNSIGLSVGNSKQRSELNPSATTPEQNLVEENSFRENKAKADEKQVGNNNYDDDEDLYSINSF